MRARFVSLAVAATICLTSPVLAQKAATTGSSAPPSATAPHATGAGASQASPVSTTAAGQFASESQAKSHCPSDTVVWANLNSHVYHYSGAKSFGKSKRGAYMCEADAKSGGFHAAKNEKHT